MIRLLGMATIVIVIAGCGTDGPNYGKSATVNLGQANLALKSSAGEENTLLVGDSLLIQSKGLTNYFEPNQRVRATLYNQAKPLVTSDLLTNMKGELPLQTLAHDVGEFEDGAKPGSVLKVDLAAGNQVISGEIQIKNRLQISGPGWGIQEVNAPYIVAANRDGKPANSFVIGGSEEGEITGPIHAMGDHFPLNQKVCLYVAKDGDNWKNQPIPQKDSAKYIAGPVEATTDGQGNLPLTSTGFEPKDAKQLGPYDIIADVDCNGMVDWSLTAKDALDGHNKVGFTVQYSQAFLKQKDQHLIVNLAYNSDDREDGAYKNKYTDGQVYGYVNPPVGEKILGGSNYHSQGIWVVVEANPEILTPNMALDEGCAGCRDLKPYMLLNNSVANGGGTGTGAGGGDTGEGGGNNGGNNGGGIAVPIQKGCTNAPPQALMNVAAPKYNQKGERVERYFVVLLPHQNDSDQLIYRPGKSWIDPNGVDETQEFKQYDEFIKQAGKDNLVGFSATPSK